MTLEIGKTYKNGWGWNVTIMGEYTAPPHRRYVGICNRGDNTDPIVRVYTAEGKQLQNSDGTGGVLTEPNPHLILTKSRYLRLGTKSASELFESDPDFPTHRKNPVLRINYEGGIVTSVDVIHPGNANTDWSTSR